MSEWLSVNDRLPEKDMQVLAWEDLSRIGLTFEGFGLFYYRRDFGFVYLVDDDDVYDNITHWMPLPEPPEIREIK